MKTLRPRVTAVLSGLLILPGLAHPEDIDLYTGGSSGGDSNVLIVLDNESNWDSTGAYFVGTNVGIGLMMYGSGSNKGGYIQFGVRRMTPTNRAALIQVLKDTRGRSRRHRGNDRARVLGLRRAQVGVRGGNPAHRSIARPTQGLLEIHE